MFEQRVLEEARVRRGLVFVQTDHGFNLGHVPGVDPEEGVLVARARRDAHDALLWERLGRPASYLYVYDPFGSASVGRLLPYEPRRGALPRLEAESAWPPLLVRGGWAHPSHATSSCTSGGRGLRLSSTSGAVVRVGIELPVLRAGRYLLTSGWTRSGARFQRITLEVAGQRTVHQVPESAPSCFRTPPLPVQLRAGAQRLEAALEGAGGLFDYVELAAAN
jgi:hypothetical protein